MPVIKVKDNESFEGALKRFKKSCEKAGILTELRRREFYDKPSLRKKKKAAAARKRAPRRPTAARRAEPSARRGPSIVAIKKSLEETCCAGE